MVLSVEELERARVKILQWIQEESFPKEVAALRQGKAIDNKSKLLTLKPFMKEDGLIRVGGCISNANVTEEYKHPIVLPASHHMTTVIIREEHRRLKHCSPSQLLSSIRQQYWPLSGSREARKVTRSCVLCFKYKPNVPDVIMGDLPSERVNILTCPFESTGLITPVQFKSEKVAGEAGYSFQRDISQYLPV